MGLYDVLNVPVTQLFDSPVLAFNDRRCVRCGESHDPVDSGLLLRGLRFRGHPGRLIFAPRQPHLIVRCNKCHASYRMECIPASAAPVPVSPPTGQQGPLEGMRSALAALSGRVNDDVVRRIERLERLVNAEVVRRIENLERLVKIDVQQMAEQGQTEQDAVSGPGIPVDLAGTITEEE